MVFAQTTEFSKTAGALALPPPPSPLEDRAESTGPTGEGPDVLQFGSLHNFRTTQNSALIWCSETNRWPEYLYYTYETLHTNIGKFPHNSARKFGDIFY